MRCCDAPDDARTTIGHDEVRQRVTVPTMVATDVRGVLFPTVYKYEERDEVRLTFGRKVVHSWVDPETGQQMGLWHWDLEVVGT